MANPLTTAQLSEAVREILPTIVENESILTKAGASSVSYETDKIKTLTIGGPANVAEGAAKPAAVLGKSEEDLLTTKLTQVIIVTDEFMDTPEGRKDAAYYIEAAVKSMVEGSDITVLAGTSPSTGAAVTAYNNYALKLKAVGTGNGTWANVEADVITALQAANRPTATIVSPATFGKIRFATNTAGSAKYPDIDGDGSIFWGTPLYSSNVVGLSSWTEAADNRNDDYAYMGPWDKIIRAFRDVEVRIGREGPIGGVNLLEKNAVAYIIEQKFKWLNLAPTEFTKVYDNS